MLGCQLLLENPSTYLVFPESTMSETLFIAELVRRTGCGLLLDISNVFVSATNHGFAARDYLADFPLDHVGEIHLAGHTRQADDEGELLLIDSHDRPVADAVWRLFDVVISQCGPIPTLIEWDSDLPDWARLKAEADAAQMIFDRKGHRTLETRRREDVACMTGVGEPLHDRAQTLRHAGGCVADAVVIDQEKSHG